jgi:hypothetical protein
MSVSIARPPLDLSFVEETPRSLLYRVMAAKEKRRFEGQVHIQLFISTLGLDKKYNVVD